ncbi:hypothetical protein [Vibrio owensii]|uniref:hypothetical protein n=1 Tax=Vibrio owensii TaxID=696485 RepID=UPI003CE45EC6
MTDKVTIESAVSGLHSSMSSQLKNILSLLDNNMDIIDSAINGEIEEFNTVLDEVKTLRADKETLELKLNSQKEAHGGEITELTKQLSEKTRQLTAANLKLGTFSEIKDQLKKLREMQPERLKDRLDNTKKRNGELLADNQKLRSDNKKYRTDYANLEAINAKLESQAIEVHNQYKHMADLLNHQDGEVVKREFKGSNGLSAYINVYSYPLNFKSADIDDFNIINDFNFHIEIKTNRAINLTASCSVWAVCFLPHCQDLESDLPEDLNSAVRKIYLDRMESSHPHLVDRIDVMQDTGLDEIPNMPEKFLKLLNASDFFSVYSVAHVPDFELVKRVKGLGSKSIKEIRTLVNEHIRGWERENWEADKVGKYN